MATNPNTLPENSGRITAPDANYTYGSAKDDSTGTTGDGTPIKKAILNDNYGFQQWLLTQAGIVPSGTADNVLNSQYGDALKVILAGGLYSSAINYPVDTYVKGSDGKIYQSLITNGPATTTVDPVGDGTGTWKEAFVSKHLPDQDISSYLRLLRAGGSQGGEIRLDQADTSTFSGDCVIDIEGDKLRILEAGGSGRGATLSLTSLAASAGSEILTEQSTALDSRYIRISANDQTVASFLRFGKGSGSAGGELRFEAADTSTFSGDAVVDITDNQFRILESGGSNRGVKLDLTTLPASVGTELLVGNQKQVCTAWVNFDGTGTVSINDSFNVSSITDNGTGDYTINFSSTYANSNYCLTAWCRDFDTNGDAACSALSGDTKTTSAIQIRTVNTFNTGGSFDLPEICVAIFGGN
jgi:hypothetical protein